MRKVKFLLGCFILLAFLFYYQPFFPLMVKPLIASDQLKKADAIVILGNGLSSKSTLSPNTTETMNYGLKLFQEGYANKVILSGGKFQADKKVALVMYDYALFKGFSPESFLLEQSSKSIDESILFSRKIIAKKNIKSIILVSSPYQSALIKKIFTDKGIKVISSPVLKKEFYTTRRQDRTKVWQIVAGEYLNKFSYELLHFNKQ